MVLYKLNCKKSGQSESYGIDAYQNGASLRQIPDISFSKEDIEKIVGMCNELELELCHLDDIIEDYLTDFQL